MEKPAGAVSKPAPGLWQFTEELEVLFSKYGMIPPTRGSHGWGEKLMILLRTMDGLVESKQLKVMMDQEKRLMDLELKLMSARLKENPWGGEGFR